MQYIDLGADLVPVYSSGYSGDELAEFDLMDDFDFVLADRLASRGLQGVDHA